VGTDTVTTAQYACCFCGELIERNRMDPVLITVALEDDAEQDLHCHWSCFKSRIHPSVTLYIWAAEDKGTET
jgi:hypothetical protein